MYFNTPQKKLGQNFLKNKKYAHSLIKYIQPEENIIEIGPGKGFITEEILKKTKNLICIEKDPVLSYSLKEKFDNLNIINKDVLSIDLKDIPFDKFTIVSALPYNISKNIISKFLKDEIRASNIYVILQKEVAQKYTTPGDLLFNTVSIYSTSVERGDVIDNKNFYPSPKVQSQIIYIKQIKTFNKEDVNLENFIKKGYIQPRKKLKNNLKLYNIEGYEDKRAHELNLEEWINLFRKNTISS